MSRNANRTTPADNTTKDAAKDKTQPLTGVVIPVDNRSSVEHVQDACFEGLIRTYTDKRDWQMVEQVGDLYERVLTDRHLGDAMIQTPVQNDDSDPKELM